MMIAALNTVSVLALVLGLLGLYVANLDAAQFSFLTFLAAQNILRQHEIDGLRNG